MPAMPITITDLDPADLTAARQVEAIFFEASARSFGPGPEREAFRERWLGRYLRGAGDIALVALAGLSGGEEVAGYLVGAVEDPARQERFADLGYFRADFRPLTARYPAHLHINLAPAYRSRGLGARLIEAFAARAAAAGAAGMHVVTGAGMRNVRFYERCGFAERGRTSWNGHEIVFLARALQAPFH
jgi:GNAT superfamily N-acetyltransferase